MGQTYLGAGELQRTRLTFLQQPLVKGFTPPRNLPVTCETQRTIQGSQYRDAGRGGQPLLSHHPPNTCSLQSAYLFIGSASPGYQHHMESRKASYRNEEQTSHAHHSHAASRVKGPTTVLFSYTLPAPSPTAPPAPTGNAFLLAPPCNWETSLPQPAMLISRHPHAHGRHPLAWSGLLFQAGFHCTVGMGGGYVTAMRIPESSSTW